MTTRITLRRDLSDLKQSIYELGEKCIEISSLFNSIQTNYNQDLEDQLKELIKEIKIESNKLHEQCFLVLTLQQPLIKDLRFVVGSLQVVISLEKIADLFLVLLSTVDSTSFINRVIHQHFLDIGAQLENLLKSSLMMYLSSNITIQKNIDTSRNIINASNDLIYKNILSGIGSSTGEEAQIQAKLLSTLRILEKLTDLIINITEQTIFIVRGKNITN